MTPEVDEQTEGQRQVRPEGLCPHCGSAVGLQRHGTYGRWITTLIGALLRLLVARFLCPRCRRTVSYLPDFALSYRPVDAQSFQAYLEGERQRRDVQSHSAQPVGARLFNRRRPNLLGKPAAITSRSAP